MKLINSVGVFAALLSGCMTPAPAQFTDDLFDKYEIVTGSTKGQTVLTGFLLGDAVAELAVVGIDGNNDRRLRIYAFEDGAWAPVFDTTLRPDVLFVDVANIGGHDRLLTWGNGHLKWFDPDSATERVLLDVAMNFKASDEGGIPHVDLTRDLNGDGRDDLVVPGPDGFLIHTQLGNGSFSRAVKLGPPEPFLDAIAVDDKRSYGEAGISALTIPWYLSRVHEMDYTRDGRIDLVFWNEDHFDVYHQDEHGRFDPVAETFPAAVPFDSDGTYSLIFGFGDASTFSLLTGLKEKTRQTVLHSFQDMNGDGVADLTTHSLEGRSVLKQRSLFEVHFGAPARDGIRFARDAGMAIQRQGNAGGGNPPGYSSMTVQDIDGDGQVDVTLARVKTGISKMFRAMLGNSITLDLEFYRIRDGIFPGEPTAVRKIRPEISPLSGKGPFFPTVLGGDVNGDGRAELLVGMGWEELHVYRGVPGPDLFAREPQTVAVAMPADERNAWLVDINKDGRQDVLVNRPSGTGPAGVTLLIAR